MKTNILNLKFLKIITITFLLMSSSGLYATNGYWGNFSKSSYTSYGPFNSYRYSHNSSKNYYSHNYSYKKSHYSHSSHKKSYSYKKKYTFKRFFGFVSIFKNKTKKHYNKKHKNHTSVPLDGGLSILLVGAAIFGVRKLRGKNNAI